MRRWTILNVLLAVIVGLLGIEIVRTWARAVPSVDLTPRPPAPAREAEKHAKGKRGATDKTAGHVEQSPTVMVAAVAEKDLFDPSRRGPTRSARSATSAPRCSPPSVCWPRCATATARARVNRSTSPCTTRPSR